jgi:hypothetical protein
MQFYYWKKFQQKKSILSTLTFRKSSKEQAGTHQRLRDDIWEPRHK